MIKIPYLYRMPGGGMDDPVWYAGVLEHEPRIIDAEQDEFMLYETEKNYNYAFVAEGRCWIHGVIELASWDRTDPDHVQIDIEAVMSGKPLLPVAGWSPAQIEAYSRIPIAKDGIHDHLPQRIAAEAQAKEIASMTAMYRDQLWTSSYEPMISMIRSRKQIDGDAVVLKDVHGHWRHPILRKRFSESPGPYVPMFEAQRDGKALPWAGEGGLDTIEASKFAGFVPTIPEMDIVCYDTLRSAIEEVAVVMKRNLPVEDASWKAITEGQRLLDEYEDWSAPIPSCDGTLAVLPSIFSMVEEKSGFGAALAKGGKDRVSMAKFAETFDRWWDLRGSRLAAGIERQEDPMDEAAVASFSM